MKVMLEKISVEHVPAEVPEKCPQCGADFTDQKKQNLVEDQLIGSEQEGFINNSIPETPFPECGGDYKEFFEIIYAIGYRCRCCNYVLASTEEEVVPPKKEESHEPTDQST